MTDLEKLTNAIYEFILYELGQREDEYKDAFYSYHSSKNITNMFAVVVAWIELEYFKRMYRRLMEYLKYFSA